VMYVHIDTDPVNFSRGTDVNTTAEVTVPMESLSGDIFGSIDNNMVTLPKGKYEIVTPIGAYYGCGWVSSIIRDGAGNLVHQINNVANKAESDNDREFSEASRLLTFDSTTTLAFYTKMQTATTYGCAYPGRIKIRKLA